MTARCTERPAPAAPAAGRRSRSRGRPARFAALLAVLLLPLAACSLLPTESGDPRTGPPPARSTDGPSGDPADFAATCTGEGRLQTHGSTQGTDHETQNSQGESFRFAAVMVLPEDGGEPSAELRLQLPDAHSEDLPGLHVGDTAEFDDWTVTIRSICADGIGFDAEVEVAG